ncbi:heparinase II/III family protein [Brachybacterium sp. NBEC-018]|uniref:heparinase II/III family protein n=1 Tax=Brachybacterium sp. NBEC-018 TaxID=2996004 RepID=UPI002174DD92|nr:heparinase II/III family protein [Brachybacterium sp. NBEC-018]UVY82723.1 heparinase II/III family protein [Brachybacterium sp. NBEC-018]
MTVPSRLSDLLTPPVLAALRPGAWRAAPPVADRAAWEHVPAAHRGRVLEAAEAWQRDSRETPPSLELWNHYHRTGERLPYDTAQRLLLNATASAALALALTGEDRWRRDLADDVWRLCELSAWCLPSHYALPEDGSRPPLPQPGRDVLDLACGYAGGMLAAVDSFAGEALEEEYPGIRARMHHEIRTRVLRPWREEVYFWHGIEETPNNWAPWIVSNALLCAAALEEDPAVLAEDSRRALAILDRFRAGYAADGSCDEGATYWWWAGATLFEALDLLEEITDGALDGFVVEPVAAMAAFPMRMQISADSQVNYSDGAASLPPNASWHLLARFGERVQDEAVAAHARWMGGLHPLRLPEQLAPQFLRTLHELRDPAWREAGPEAPGMPRSWYAPGTELAVMREEEGEVRGWFLAAKGGHNDVSHNHDDVGGVIASLDGLPVLIDAGVGDYRRETFLPETRYTIWTMRSGFHSCPLPGGFEQPPGIGFRAAGTVFSEDGDRAALSADLAGAYPEAAGLRRCERTATLDRRRREVRIEDDWEAAAPLVMEQVLMTLDRPVPLGEGRLRIGPAELQLDPPDLAVRIEEIPLTDARLRGTWGERVHRTVLTPRTATARGRSSFVLRRGPGAGGATA